MARLSLVNRNIIFRNIWNAQVGLIFYQIEYNNSRSRNVLDVRAALKDGLQMEQGNFPSH